MASNFITKQEVIDLAFEKADLRTAYIKDASIEVAELKYIRPAVTEPLFNRLNQEDSSLSEDEVALKSHLKKALAYFIGYLIIPGISVQITNKGAQLPSSMHSNTATDKQRGELRENFLAMGNAYKDEAVKFIEDNPESFKDYYEHYQSSNNRVKVKHGIIF